MQSCWPHTNAFCAFFLLHLSKVLRLPRKSEARSYEVLHLSREIILANLKIRCSKMQPLSGNQRPDLLTSLMNKFLVLCLPREMHLCRSSSNAPPRLPSFLEMLKKPLRFCSLLAACRAPCACHTKPPANFKKCSETLVCFLHFDLEMCFAPQRRAIFHISSAQMAPRPPL